MRASPTRRSVSRAQSLDSPTRPAHESDERGRAYPSPSRSPSPHLEFPALASPPASPPPTTSSPDRSARLLHTPTQLPAPVDITHSASPGSTSSTRDPPFTHHLDESFLSAAYASSHEHSPFHAPSTSFPSDFLPPAGSTPHLNPSEEDHDEQTRRRPPAAYSSLPSSPTGAFVKLDLPKLDLSLLEATFATEELEEEATKSPASAASVADVGPTRPTSLWDYLQEEIWATDFDSHQEMKWERVSNFLQVPLAIEKIITFGSLVCLDSFLYVFTILPIRSLIAFSVLARNYWDAALSRSARRRMAPSQKIDMLKFILLLLSCAVLVWGTDASYMYHSIRGQDSIKLVVIFNAFEIADRLCCAFGQDVLDSLFARETLSRRQNGTQPHMRPTFFFLISLIYVVVHALVLLYQLISLNVAVNSYDYALLTLLVSNQFAEIKGSVFKKFEKENLFQIACADIVERFQLGLMLTVIAFRNLIEMSGSDFAFLPRSFIKGKGNVETIFSPALIVLASEMAVDWVKHAYITKFNHIRVSVYERFTDVLCRDLVTAGAHGIPDRKKHAFADQSPLVSRRLGFASLPLTCLVIRIAMQALGMASRLRSGSSSFEDDEDANPRMSDAAKWAAISLGVFVCWICLVVFKIVLGINLLNFASKRYKGMDARRIKDDRINDFERDPLGEGKDEQNYNKTLSALLDRTTDDQKVMNDMGAPVCAAVSPDNSQAESKGEGEEGGSSGGGGEPEAASSAALKKAKKKKLAIEETSRWTMHKRIF